MDDLPFYAAYGSNLAYARMRHRSRCPGAEPLGAALLQGWRLMVGRYATITPDEAGSVPIGLWRITPRHLRALDRVEGTALGVYRRIRIRPAAPLGEVTEAWTYVEQAPRPGPPADWYVAHLRQGYRDFGLEPSPLEAALSASGLR
jgi:gamma-glutamylcyclotransferase (GGCT)/AIG2-like uncharacterized protein YtfP